MARRPVWATPSALNLRDQGLRHLAAAQGEHEHDMSLMGRLKTKGLRQGVPKGQRVLVVYDRAGIDYDFWNRCRKETAVYFLSRSKSNLVFTLDQVREWERHDTRHRGVLQDQWVTTPQGHRLRLIDYRDPETGREFQPWRPRPWGYLRGRSETTPAYGCPGLG